MIIYGKRITIADKSRFTMSLVFLLIIISCVFMLAFNKVSGNENILYKDYVVNSGDTIWTIADLVSSDEVDIREVVYHISQVNNISGNEHIYPGQTIRIPDVPVKSDKTVTLKKNEY